MKPIPDTFVEQRRLVYMAVPRDEPAEQPESDERASKKLKPASEEKPHLSMPEKFALSLAVNAEAKYLESGVQALLAQLVTHLDDDDPVFGVQAAENTAGDRLRYVREITEILLKRCELEEAAHEPEPAPEPVAEPAEPLPPKAASPRKSARRSSRQRK